MACKTIEPTRLVNETTYEMGKITFNVEVYRVEADDCLKQTWLSDSVKNGRKVFELLKVEKVSCKEYEDK